MSDTVLRETKISAVQTVGGVIDGSITTAKIAENAVTLAKLQQIATNMLLGRSSPGTGNVEQIALTGAGQALLDDADASTQLTTLGFSAFVKTLVDDANAGAFLTSLGVSAFIQTVLDDANAAAALNTLGAAALASPALTGAPTTPTAAPGTNTTQVANTAFVQSELGDYQPLDSDLTAIAALSTTSYGRGLLELADAAALQAQVNGAQVITVGTGGKYATISAALAVITDASSTKRYVLRLLNDITESVGVTWKSYISLDLNTFKFEVASAGSEAGITTASGVVGVLLWNGAFWRSGSTQNNTYTFYADSPVGSSGFRLLLVDLQNSCTGTNCHAGVFANGGAGSIVFGLGNANSANAGLGVYATGTNAVQIIQCNMRGIGAEGAAVVQVYHGQSLGRNATYPGVLIKDAARIELMGTRVSLLLNTPGIIANENGALMMQNASVYASPTRTTGTFTATGTISASGHIEGISVNVTVAGSAGATIAFGTSAGASDVAAAVLIDTVGIKTITLANPVPTTTTLHVTITGTGATVTVNTQRGLTSTTTPIQLNGAGQIFIDQCSIEAACDDDAIAISAAAAAAARVKISGSTIRVKRKPSGTKAAINAASACTLLLDNNVFDAPVALVNVTCAAPTATYGSNIHR